MESVFNTTHKNEDIHIFIWKKTEISVLWIGSEKEASILNRMTRAYFPEKLTFEQRPEEGAPCHKMLFYDSARKDWNNS